MDEAWPYFKDVLASDIVYLSDTASIATMNQCPQQTTRWSTSMKPLLILTLGVALAVGACGAPTSDTTDAASEGLDTSTGVADTSLDITSSVDTETPPSSENTAAPAQPVYPRGDDSLWHDVAADLDELGRIRHQRRRRCGHGGTHAGHHD